VCLGDVKNTLVTLVLNSYMNFLDLMNEKKKLGK